MNTHTIDIEVDGVAYIMQWQKPDLSDGELGSISITEACMHTDENGECEHEIYDFEETVI